MTHQLDTEKMTTITASTPHGYAAGDLITMSVPDPRWWRRLLFKLTFRGTPHIECTFRLLSSGSLSMEIDDAT